MIAFGNLCLACQVLPNCFTFVLGGRIFFVFCCFLRSQFESFFPLGAHSVQYCLEDYGACQRLGSQHHSDDNSIKIVGRQG